MYSNGIPPDLVFLGLLVILVCGAAAGFILGCQYRERLAKAEIRKPQDWHS